MEISQKYVLMDDDVFVASFDLEQQVLCLTPNLAQAVQVTPSEAKEVLDCLGWLASSKLEVLNVSVI